MLGSHAGDCAARDFLEHPLHGSSCAASCTHAPLPSPWKRQRNTDDVDLGPDVDVLTSARHNKDLADGRSDVGIALLPSPVCVSGGLQSRGMQHTRGPHCMCWTIILACLLLLVPAASGGGGASETARLGAEAVIADLVHLQHEMLQRPTDLDGKRVVLCKTVSGLGNRMQAIMSCLALAIATRRALVVQWELELSTTPPQANGLMPCRLEDVLQFPPGIHLNVSLAFQPSELTHDKVVEAYVSQMVLNSGKTPSWGDLLLCSNLTYLLKHTPVLSIPAWRWMPEILSNAAYRTTLERLFGAENSRAAGNSGPPAFFRTVAPSFIRPAPPVLAAATALRRYWSQDARAVGLQVRLGLATDNRDETAHFFTPANMWRSWLRCAYTALSQQLPTMCESNACTTASADVFFIAADSTEAKVAMLMQMSREEGPVASALNLERVTTEQQRAILLQQADTGSDIPLHNVGQVGATGHSWLDDVVQPVVVDFASGTRLVFFARHASRVECEDVQIAMLEMHVLSWSHVLVASHLSTFAALPAASVAADDLHYVNRDGDCFPALSLEPVSDAGDLFRDTAHCFSERHILQHSWSRPRRRSVRKSLRQHVPDAL